MRVINKPSGPATPAGYAYGSPSGAGGSTGGGTVVAQWIFEEASGDAVDAVNSISVGTNGTCQRLMETDTFRAGTFGAATGQYKFTTNTDPTAMNLGTNSFVVEAWWIQNTWGTASEQFPFDFRQTVSGTAGFAASFGSDGTVLFYLEADDGSANSTFWASVFTADSIPVDGVQKMRFIVDRSGANATITLVYNGTTFATKNFGLITSALTISPTAVNLGGRYDNFRNVYGIMKQVWVVSGTTTANSGGPNGG